MSYILLILAFFSSYLFFAFNPFGYSNSWILQGFSAVVMSNDGFHILIPVLINVVSIVLIYFAYRVYAHGKGKLVSDINPVFRFSNRGWYFDELYDYIFIRSIAGLSTISYAIDRHIIDRVVNASADIIRLFAALSEWLDRKIIDGLVNGIGSLARRTGNFTRKSQSGRVQQYLISMLLVLISYFLFVYFI